MNFNKTNCEIWFKLSNLSRPHARQSQYRFKLTQITAGLTERYHSEVVGLSSATSRTLAAGMQMNCHVSNYNSV